jgi:hypothetical protein
MEWSHFKFEALNFFFFVDDETTRLAFTLLYCSNVPVEYALRREWKW